MNSDGRMRRFWFPVAGHLGVGVTAATLAEAQRLAERARASCWPDAGALGPVIEDVDIRVLDQKHVVPNMRPVVWPGVWFPIGVE